MGHPSEVKLKASLNKKIFKARRGFYAPECLPGKGEDQFPGK
jgi:hypothetical protein